MPSRFLGGTINRKEVIVLPAIAGVLAFLGWGHTDAPISLKAREAITKDSLRTVRKMIDQYAADHRALPSSLDDLVREGYLRDVPFDPLTFNRDWDVEMGELSVAGTNHRGVIDIHSNAPGRGSDGIQYRDY